MGKKLLIGFLVIGAISMLVMSFHYFQSGNTGILKRKEVAATTWYIVTFRTHIFFGLLAIITGPIQFVKRFRTRYTIAHRSLGYTYFISVIFSSLSGLFIAQYAMGGYIAATGFTVLSILWFSVTLQSILAICQNNYQEHRKWSFLFIDFCRDNSENTTISTPPNLSPVYAHIPTFSLVTVGFKFVDSVSPPPINIS